MNEEFSEWIRNHKVCYIVAPLKWFFDARVQQIGFELTLYAQNAEAIVENEEKNSYKLYKRLVEIVQTAIAQDKPGCRCEVLSYDFAFHLRPVTRLKNEVQVIVLVVNGEKPFRPADEFLATCVSQIQNQLANMGARYRVWQQN
jgi:hypothetical protein